WAAVRGEAAVVALPVEASLVAEAVSAAAAPAAVGNSQERGHSCPLRWPLHHNHAFAFRQFTETIAKAFSHRPELAIANGAAIEARYGGQFAHRPGAEHFIGPVQIRQRQI